MSLTPIFHQARKQVSQTKPQDRGKQGTDSLKGESMLFLDEMRSNIHMRRHSIMPLDQKEKRLTEAEFPG